MRGLGTPSPSPMLRTSMRGGYQPSNAYRWTDQTEQAMGLQSANSGAVAQPMAVVSGVESRPSNWGSVDVTPMDNSKAFNAIAAVFSRKYPGKGLPDLIGAIVLDDGYTFQVLGPQTFRSWNPSESNPPSPKGPNVALKSAPPGSSTTKPKGKKIVFDANTASQILTFVTQNAPGAIDTVKQIIASTESLPSLEKKLAKYKEKLKTETNPVKRAEDQSIIKTLEGKIALYKQQADTSGGLLASGAGLDDGTRVSSALPSWLPWAALGLVLVGGAVVVLSKGRASAVAAAPPKVLLGA